MASRSRKSTSFTESSSGTPARASRVAARAPSPARTTRLQEKEELIGLNSRLAAYIERVQNLERDNESLSLKVQTYEESAEKVRHNVSALYESEMGDLRRLLDALAKEKAELEIEVGKYRGEADDLRSRLARKENDYASLEKRFRGLEAEVAALRAQASDAESRRKFAEEEMTRARAEVSQLQRSLDAAKAELEKETLMRVDLENRLQSVKEELDFQRQLHAQEVREERRRLETTMEEVDTSRRADYENQLLVALEELRSELEERAVAARDEMAQQYDTRINDLRSIVERNSLTSTYSRDEMRKLRERADLLNAEIAKLKGENAMFSARVSELEQQLVRERDESSEALAARDREINELREHIVGLMSEYQDLMDIKVRLDAELVAYRKMLEGEEARLNISETQSPSGSPSLKRRRVGDTSSYSSQAAFESSGTASGIVEIEEVDTKGQYVKLRNTSAEEDQPLGGWQLKLKVGDSEITYKFHRSFNLKSGQNVKVWSSDAGATHSPPSDVVMKNQAWPSGAEMAGHLYDSSGDEQAARTVSKVYRAVSTSSHSRRSQQDRCTVM